MEFEANKLKASVITDIANDVATGKLADSNAMKTYVDDAKAHAIVASNNTFVDSVASLGSGNVQGAIEAVKALVDTNITDITNAESDISEVNQDITDAMSA